jgi:phosphoenolpyruvate carboxykinase (ATP)
MATLETKIEKLSPIARSIEANPPDDRLRELARHHERTTEFGSPSFVTEVRARSAKDTRNTVDGQLTEADMEVIREVREYLRGKDLIQVDRTMGRGDHPNDYACRLFVSSDFARLALMFDASLRPPHPGKWDEPDFITVDVPDWPGERAILVDPLEGITYVLASDYYGEIKKSFLRQAMFRAKQEGRLGLHAGSKQVRVRGADGKLHTHGMLFFGLSGTGKTSLTCHSFNLEAEEGVHVRQDDVVLLDRNGRAFGTEGGGFYIKTEGLSPEDQAALFSAAVSPTAILENVWVAEDGTVDFHNTRLTGNGRAVVRISEVRNTDGNIDLERADKIFFITRNGLCPAACKLTPEQAAVAFMLGESIKTSAADPNAKGEPVRVVGTNPFIVGPPGEEGDIFYEILQANPDIECYLVNTGGVGEGASKVDIKILDTVRILTEIARNVVDWTADESTGLQIPRHIDGVAPTKFRVADHYSAAELEERLREQRRARDQWLDRFPSFDEKLKSAVY